MHQIFRKLNNKLTLRVLGGLAVSVTIISALTFSFYSQNNSGNDNGNYSVKQQGNGNSVGGRGNTQNINNNSPK
ncbi:MAG: hypothetical protein V7L04_00690 [Nostoc sp.]|uniref:hypothetical protein n=1 Tax=Nostoc sp. TaxID=1180 RepID=UPI002FFBA02C